MKRDNLDSLIPVKSANVELGAALPQHARDCILRATRKYFDEMTAASVYFSREGAFIRATVNIQVGSLKMISAAGNATDCYQAFDQAFDRIEKQLRRKKRELRDSRPARSNKLVTAAETARL